MKDIIGIAWYKDEDTFRRAIALYTDTKDMPVSYEKWHALVNKELKEIKNAGNIALRVDIEPGTFIDWCRAHSFLPNSKGRVAYVNYSELEYEKTGKGTIIE